MQALEYNAVMKTPIGYRIGFAIVQITDQIVSGCIRFFEKEGKYQGTIDSNGNMTIQGEMPSPNEVIKFNGIGKISFYSLHLELSTVNFVYEVDGTARR